MMHLSGPILICSMLLLCGGIIFVGSLRLAAIELAKPLAVDRVMKMADVRDPRVFDAYRASALFGGWVVFWSGLGIAIPSGAFDVDMRDALFDADQIGLLYWLGLLGCYAIFLIYRRQEHFGKHPFQRAELERKRKRDAARA